MKVITHVPRNTKHVYTESHNAGFSLNVFNSCLLQENQNAIACGKWLNVNALYVPSVTFL